LGSIVHRFGGVGATQRYGALTRLVKNARRCCRANASALLEDEDGANKCR
jgi:hypothetical protein